MRILKATYEGVLAASQVVRRGGLVVYPTDTVYGLGCDPLNPQAVRRVFRVKGERRKPLPVLASDVRQAERIAQIPLGVRRVVERFWPGPLTIVVPKRPILPGIVTYGVETVGVRVPNHQVALQLIKFSGGLLVGTSANKTGERPPRTVQEAIQQLGGEVDAYLDAGPTPGGVPSTVVDFTRHPPMILREGPIRLKEILSALGQHP